VIITQQNQKLCFVPCSKEKIEQGQCDCSNRMQQQLITELEQLPDFLKQEKENKDE
jgi:hypothetical protein